MKQIYPDVWQIHSEHPFHGVTSHAYLFVQEAGNILFYNSRLHEDEYQKIDELGGIVFQYLSHMDEAGPSLQDIKNVFGAKLFCHHLEEHIIGKNAHVDDLFTERETIGNVEIIPTPGHTAGCVCFFVTSPFGKKYLFSGDTVSMSNGVWESRVNGYGGGSRSDLKNSLLLLQELEPDVVIFSASIGDVSFKEVSVEEWRSGIDDILRSI